MNYYVINVFILNKILVSNMLLCFMCEIRENWGRRNGEGRKCPRTRVCLLLFHIFLAFLVKKTSGILIFGPSFRKPARKASSGEIYLKNKDLYATDL